MEKEKVKEELVSLFEDMLEKVGQFKSKTYQALFETGYEKHKDIIAHISGLCSEKDEEENGRIVEELATVLPEHAYEKARKLSGRKKERATMDDNMNMAVYVLPVLTYTKDETCMRVAARTVELWNERKINSLVLSLSTYEQIAGGFRKGLCFITEAVCGRQGKPDDCYELTVLRRYRDRYLMRTAEGRLLVEEYYDTAPYLVQILNMQPEVSEIYARIYRRFLSPCIRCIEEKNYEGCKHIYVDMVRSLQKKYIDLQEV